MAIKNNTKSKRGFTIIEVVLVLAVAGLIFMMVFLALPALQRSQRNTQRRDDLSRALSAVQNYQTNNRGKLPDFKATFITQYLKSDGDTFNDPSGDAYTFYSKVTSGALATAGLGTCVAKSGSDTQCTVQVPTTFKAGAILAMKNATCDGETLRYVSGSTRVALAMRLEGAGVACVSN